MPPTASAPVKEPSSPTKDLPLPSGPTRRPGQPTTLHPSLQSTTISPALNQFLSLPLLTTKRPRKLRLPGVLQRFGLAYLAVGLLEALQLPRQFLAPPALMADLYSAPWQWLAAATCVALQTCLTFFLQVPGCPTGYLGPGGK